MTTKIEDQRCQNCRYLQSDDRSTQCYRYPPNTDDRWPYVGLFDWCGEWAAEEQELKPGPVMPKAIQDDIMRHFDGLGESLIAARRAFEALAEAGEQAESPAE